MDDAWPAVIARAAVKTGRWNSEPSQFTALPHLKIARAAVFDAYGKYTPHPQGYELGKRRNAIEATLHTPDKLQHEESLSNSWGKNKRWRRIASHLLHELTQLLRSA